METANHSLKGWDIRDSLLLVLLLWSMNRAHATVLACKDLNGYVIPSTSIGMPSRGGFVRSARHIEGVDGGYCRLLGQIVSIAPAAHPIRYEVNLPETWNGRALQFGGAIFDGYLRESDGRHSTVLGDKGQLTPLARGYATFGSDSGHHKHYLFLPDIFNLGNSDFGFNEEERRNFTADSLKKTHDVAAVLIQAYYGIAPKRMYFIGGSEGGREAMKAVDLWPDDYDGVIAAYASWNQIETDLQFIRVSQAMYAKGKDGQAGWLPPAKTKLLRNAVLNACDAKDGLKDGIISDPAGCSFEASVLRCRDGKDHRGCLSEGQERTVLAFSTPQISTFSVEHGINYEPGYNVLRGADLVGNMGWFSHPFHPPIPFFNSPYYVIADGIVRTFLGVAPQVDLFQINTTTGGATGHPTAEYLPRVHSESIADDASLADLSAFEEHGGKLLLIHGVADATIPTDASVLLYHRIVEAMGQKRADGFVQLYLIPGFGHGVGVFFAGFDTIGVLDRWANEGKTPADLIAIDQNKHRHRRERPMCLWPSWPRFAGGDPNAAGSFTCVGHP
jgi:Tannase and feruloyl esterase